MKIKTLNLFLDPVYSREEMPKVFIFPSFDKVSDLPGSDPLLDFFGFYQKITIACSLVFNCGGPPGTEPFLALVSSNTL